MVIKRLVFAAFVALSTIYSAQSAGVSEDQSMVRNVLINQQAAWNAGDLEAFMEGYWRSPDLRFASGGSITRGWQETLSGYHSRYPDRAAMGTLAFDLLEVNILGGDSATVFGRWTLQRAHDKPGGLFTLMFRRIDGEWKIISDHTSSN